MCFMAIDELDEVNSNFSDEEVKEKFSIVEISKTHLEKENEILKKKNEWLTSSLSIFSYGKKSFEMILTSQKCVFDTRDIIQIFKKSKVF